MNLTYLIRREIKLVIVSIFCFLLAAFGLSYGFLTSDNNRMSTDLSVGSATFPLILSDNTTITETDIEPGDTFTKTITVQNRGNRTVKYNLIWFNLLNEIELQLSATCSSSVQGNTCSAIAAQTIPLHSTEVNDELIKKNISIAAGEIHTYVVTVKFIDEEDLQQEYDVIKHFHGKINIEESADVHPLYNVMKTLAAGNTYAGTYTGNDTNDTYGETATKTIYYIKTSSADNATQANELINNKINVKFAGFCWQILRTTDTGGIKLIYNGEYVEGTGCYSQTDTEHTHKGIIGTNGTSGDMTGNYMYSDTFTYNTSTNQFTLVNPVVKNWSNSSDKEYILGKYTCKENNITSTCSTLYYINTPHRTTANNAWYTTYTIGNTQNAQIGTSPFNANYYSPAYIGYKYGDTAYEYVGNSAPTSGSIMGNTVYWNGSNYELRESGGTTTSTGTEYNDTHHYTCNSTSATCTGGKVRYYYYNNYYIELTGGDKVEDAISKMLTNSTNTHDSAMKAYLENWYYNNIYGTDAENYIEQDAVYCNDRSISNLGGWSKDGSKSTTLQFNNYNKITSLGCTNNTDKFSVNNTNAQLKYPIGLADAPEMNLINNLNIRKTGQYYWLVSPYWFYNVNASGRRVYTSGSFSYNDVYVSYGARPVVSLAPSNKPITGDGSLSNPYVIE